MINLFIISSSLLTLYLFTIFKSNYNILKGYAGINSILFASQGLFIVLFGFSHPQFDIQKINYIQNMFFWDKRILFRKSLLGVLC